MRFSSPQPANKTAQHHHSDRAERHGTSRNFHLNHLPSSAFAKIACLKFAEYTELGPILRAELNLSARFGRILSRIDHKYSVSRNRRETSK